MAKHRHVTTAVHQSCRHIGQSIRLAQQIDNHPARFPKREFPILGLAGCVALCKVVLSGFPA